MDYNMQKFRCNRSRPRVSPNRSIVSDSVSPSIGIARHRSDFLLGLSTQIRAELKCVYIPAQSGSPKARSLVGGRRVLCDQGEIHGET